MLIMGNNNFYVFYQLNKIKIKIRNKTKTLRTKKKY